MNQPRKFWEEMEVLKAYTVNRGRNLIVVVGADDPDYLEGEKAKKLARKTAHKKGFLYKKGMGEIRVYGQNELATREFYYART